MAPQNFTAADILGTLLAFVLFIPVLVIPGYVVGQLLNLLDFQKRTLPVRLGFALLLSISFSPVFLFLCWRLVSIDFLNLALFLFLVSFVIILFRTTKTNQKISTNAKIFILIGIGWIIISVLSSSDLQWGNRLYFSVATLDHTTRISITNAIAKTGVPPINPGYYPGKPVLLTFLYYYWYVLTGVVTIMGAGFIDGHHAMYASIAWIGLALMTLASIYLRLRTPQGRKSAWHTSFVAIQMYLVGGLDIIPTLILLATSQATLGKLYYDGGIEHWNEQIPIWLTSVFWTPHHLASLAACMTALLLAQHVRAKNITEQVSALSIAGLAFASAFGLSAYVTVVFGMGWVISALINTISPSSRRWGFLMLLTAAVALIADAPFIIDLLSGSSGDAVGLPLSLSIRRFNLLLPFIDSWTPIQQAVMNLLFLPVNYLLELGFFLVIGFFWFKRFQKSDWRNHSFYQIEIILLISSFFMGTFVRSNVISNNDFGWRSWLPGQFVLLIWATDILQDILKNNLNARPFIISFLRPIENRSPFLALLFMIGIATSVMGIISLRIWPMFVDANLSVLPYELSSDTHLGERTYSARLAYQYMNTHIPQNVIIQNNPLEHLDRPAGLYNSHQMIIADRTAYGISQEIFKKYRDAIGVIFSNENITNWQPIDNICQKYLIDLLVINDTDPIWKNLSILKTQRPPIYENSHYALFYCGTYAQR